MKIVSKSVNETLNIGRAIGEKLHRGDIICLIGELGSGKTILTKGIAWGMGIKMGEIISPSFVLIRQHKGSRCTLNHFDLYRLKGNKDILGLGYEEYLYGDGVSVVEWADRLNSFLPKEYLKIGLFINTDTHRTIDIVACGECYKRLMKEFYEDIRH